MLDVIFILIAFACLAALIEMAHSWQEMESVERIAKKPVYLKGVAGLALIAILSIALTVFNSLPVVAP